MLIPLGAYRPIDQPKLTEPLRSLIASLRPHYVVTLPYGLYLGYLPTGQHRASGKYYELVQRVRTNQLTQLPIFVRGSFRQHAIWLLDASERWRYVSHVQVNSVGLRIPDLSNRQPMYCTGDRAQAVAFDQHGQLISLDYEPVELYDRLEGLALRIPEDWLPSEPNIASVEQLLEGLPRQWVLVPPHAKLYAVDDAHYVCLERYGLELVIPYVAREHYWDVLFWWRNALYVAKQAMEQLRVYVECRTPIRFAHHPRLWFDALWLPALPKELRQELNGNGGTGYSLALETLYGLSGWPKTSKPKVSNKPSMHHPSIVPVVRYDRDSRRLGIVEWHHFASQDDPAFSQVTLPISEYLAQLSGSITYLPMLDSDNSLVVIPNFGDFSWWPTYILHTLLTDETSIAWCLPTKIEVSLSPIDRYYAVWDTSSIQYGQAESTLTGKPLLTNTIDIYPLLMKRSSDRHWLLYTGHTPRLLLSNRTS